MKIVQLVDEDFVNYKKASMVIGCPYCNFKCDRECGRSICQNSKLANSAILDISEDFIINRYLDNEITHAIIFQGLEPFDSWIEMLIFIKEFRMVSSDDIVIYTGYTEDEIEFYLDSLKDIDNIIVKFGRYIPDQESHYDEVLGVNLASPNQYAKKIS